MSWRSNPPQPDTPASLQWLGSADYDGADPAREGPGPFTRGVKFLRL